MLHALYAYPAHGLLVIENSAIEYLGPTSNYHCASAGRKVSEAALDVEEYIGFSQVSHSAHCGFPKASQPDLAAFVERFLFKGNGSTDIWKTDDEFVKDEARWVDWSTPVLA